MMTVIISMFVFALIGAVSPGSVNIIAMGAGASFGFKRTFPHVLGATFGYTFIVFLMGMGLNHGLIFLPEIANTLRYVGSVFLLYMSYKIAMVSTVAFNKADKIKYPPSFIEGMLAQGLNPKAWIVSMSGVSLFVITQTPTWLYLFKFCIISCAVCLVGISTWAAIGHSVQGFLSSGNRLRAFNILMALMLSGTVVLIFFNN